MRLDSLRRELAEVERRLLQGDFRETDLLEEIDARRLQIALQSQVIRAQKKKRRQLGDTLRLLEGSLKRARANLSDLAQDKTSLEQQRQTLQAAFARHLSSRRRLSRWGTFEFLLGARSLSELLERRQMLANINRLEERYLIRLADQSRQVDLFRDRVRGQARDLERERRRLGEVRDEVLKAENALRSEQEKLNRQQTCLAADLEKVHGDRVLLEERRGEIEQALERIEEMVAKARIASAIEGPIPGSALTPLKGMLPWPVQGDMLAHFGRQKNRDLTTVLDNPGVDIAASPGEEVRCVADGRVSRCTWLRGFGNVIIVEHPSDFFTVYAHLEQLSVRQGDEVRARQVLGTASLDGVSGKYRIHFELWEGKQKHNPLQWLVHRQ